MNSDRIQEILDLMEEARLDYFLISDPQSIAYCTGYYNDPHERNVCFHDFKTWKSYLIHE